MPPLRSRPSARPSTGNRPDPPRRSALTAPTERNAGSVGVCGHRHGQFRRVLSAQTAPECPQEVPGGKGGTCQGEEAPKVRVRAALRLGQGRSAFLAVIRSRRSGLRSAARRRGAAAAPASRPSPTLLGFAPTCLRARAPRRLPGGAAAQDMGVWIPYAPRAGTPAPKRRSCSGGGSAKRCVGWGGSPRRIRVAATTGLCGGYEHPALPRRRPRNGERGPSS